MIRLERILTLPLAAGFITCLFSPLALLYAGPATVRITAPAANATVSGALNVAASASGAATVDYWINGHSIVSGQILGSAPYSFTLDTTQLWDGPAQIVAVARDSGGNILAFSQPLNLTIKNGNAQMQLVAPDVSQTLSGTVTWQVQARDPRGIATLTYVIDGKQDLNAHYVSGAPASYTDNYSFDTTQLTNGVHYFAAQVVPVAYPSGQPSHASAQIITQFTVNNGSNPIELRSNFSNLYFDPARTAPVQLQPHILYSDGTDQPASGASFSTTDAAIANVSDSGLVSPGGNQGIAVITIAAGGLTASVRVTNIRSHAGFAQFTKDGHIVFNYDPARSLWVRTLFDTSAQVVNDTPGLADALHQAGVNAITTNFYANPSDSGFTDIQTWLDQSAPRQAFWLSVAQDNGFSVVGTGDDIQRSPTEMNATLNLPWAADALRYTMQQLIDSGVVVSLEMEDEVGGAPVPQTFRSIMGILNSASGRPPVTWPVAGSQSPAAFAAWEGDPNVSDYGSMYWAYVRNPLPEFSWGNSLAETKVTLDQTVIGKLPSIQIDKPVYMEVLTYGNAYHKLVPGDTYHPGQDEIVQQGTQPEESTAEILYAAAMGFSGVRAYAYDGAYGQNDFLWAIERANTPAGAANPILLQSGASPFSPHQDVVDRWQAMSNAFNLIQNLEPYVLSPQINAVDLGADVTTGARELNGNAGHMLIAINMLDNAKTVTVDLTPYLYAGASSVTRYHVAGLLSTSETVSNDNSQTVTMAPGEAIVWVFTPASGVAGPPQPDSNDPSLVGYWKLNEGSGGFAYDSSGYGNTATLFYNPSWLSGSGCLTAVCLNFNGINNYGAATLDLSSTSAVTVSFWMNWAQFADNDALALEFSSGAYGFNSSSTGFMIDPNSSDAGGGKFEVAIKGDQGYNQVLFARPAAGKWHHYAFVLDKSAPADNEITPYVDGAAVPYTKFTNSANSNNFGANTLYLMTRTGSALFGAGNIAEVRIYNRALGPSEISALTQPPVAASAPGTSARPALSTRTRGKLR